LRSCLLYGLLNCVKFKDKAALDTFIAENVQLAKQKLEERFELAFHKMDESSVQRKKMMQYILAKLTQYVDERAWGSSGASAELKTYINKDVAIEHILPQNSPNEIKYSFDKPSEIERYIKRLGILPYLSKQLTLQ
jgi:hypothetical protein